MAGVYDRLIDQSMTPGERGVVSLAEHESDLVALVAQFVDNRLRPRVRHFEGVDRYPEELIEQMKKLGFFGLLIPERCSGGGISMACFARACLLDLASRGRGVRS
ncbi:acyl-CoA dehydrogenase family protein [Blastococcus aggregatus]|uniref:acyl-CoA dehydrogenase family protein n=1 Tax=Blastococcus aggregatus TaxID=38502 RepID=UPI001FE3CACA|nr:acyl-CoA dehydrogenase family protein [Blastococcus aggregatus]